MMTLDFHPRFQKQVRKHLPSSLHDRLRDQLKRFVQNPEHPSLHFEPMTGFPGCYTLRLNLHWRIHLRQIDDGHYRVLSVEGHDAYRRKSLKRISRKKVH